MKELLLEIYRTPSSKREVVTEVYRGVRLIHIIPYQLNEEDRFEQIGVGIILTREEWNLITEKLKGV